MTWVVKRGSVSREEVKRKRGKGLSRRKGSRKGRRRRRR